MGLIDLIKKILGNNKKQLKIITVDLTKTYGETTPLEIALYEDKTPVPDKTIQIEINGVTYTRTTNNDGYCKLNINLPVGKYTSLITFEGDTEYNRTTAYNQVIIKPVLNTHDTHLSYGENGVFEAKVQDNNGNPIPDTKVGFIINGRIYERTTNNTGQAVLPIRLSPGTYEIQTLAGPVTNKNNILVDKGVTRMEGTDVNMMYGDGSKYQCAVYNGNNRINGTVTITVNGRTYTRNADSEGLYRLGINLPVGSYKVLAEFQGDGYYCPCMVSNSVVVNEPPKVEPTPEPVKLRPYITTQGGGKLGQTNGYRCGPHSLMQCIYRLTGIELSEATLASICGTTTGGTSHSGLETGLAWFNRTYGYDLKIKWVNLSDIGWDGLQKAIDNGAVFCHILYRGQWGHYEVPKNSDLVILNSLGSYCSYPAYCGYIENRSKSTQQSYINGISQKSICIITA